MKLWWVVGAESPASARPWRRSSPNERKANGSTWVKPRSAMRFRVPTVSSVSSSRTV